MKRLVASVSLIATAATGALAGGLDRTGQPIQPLFEPGGANGGYLELAFGRTWPSVDGSGVGIAPFLSGGSSYDIGNAFNSIGAAYKVDLNDQWSLALIYEQPYGADVDYGGNAYATELGGTSALADTHALTAYLRYRFNDRWSVHGGIRAQRIDGEISLSGLAYGPNPADAPYIPVELGGPRGTVNGYDVDLDGDTAYGYVIGGAFEIPEIAARISLTYNSEITHTMDTTESGPDVLIGFAGAPIVGPALNGKSETEVKTPQSVNLEFRTGIAADTLLFGSVRWVDWSAFRIDPELFTNYTGDGLVDLEDTTTYALGVARRFNEQWAGSVAMSYEDAGDRLVSPLSPTTGHFAVTLGASYTMDAFTISAGARHTWLGDAYAETGTPDTKRADFSDNTATSFGVRIGYNF
ncbi:OmpP1/FadL family transporter [Tropicimonas sp.]|uniref:OmpP1/FadL family transporter n=1 Tax=Tropicimonas sp. TaxID=2067044 RepID=UPI003A83DF15